MKILFLTHYYPPEGNAPASRVSALAKRWVANGHKVTIITSAPNVPDGKVYAGYKNCWTSRETMDGVDVIRIWTYIAPNKGTIRRILNYVSYMISAFLHCLFMKKPDVMIATSPQFFCGWAGVLLHWFRRFPFILEIRDIWPESMVAVNAGLPGPILKIIGLMEKIMYKTAKHIVTVGDGYVERLKERGVPESKISVVMNGVDTTLFYPRPKNHDLLQRYNIDGKFICSYIGTIGMACGLHTALEAAEKLKEQQNDSIVFVFVGDGAERKNLEQQAKDMQLDNVIFTGRRPKNEIPDWIASSDVNLVHLKKVDLFNSVMPSKIFESAGCGRPVLMGVDGFAKKIVMDAGMGLDIEPENPDSMLNALLQLFHNHEQCEILGRNGLKNIVPFYNRDSQAEKYESILKNIPVEQKDQRFFVITLCVCSFLFAVLSLLSFWMEPTISRDGILYLELSQIWSETGSFDGVLAHWPECWIPPFPLYLMKLLIDCGFSPAVAGVGLNIIMGCCLPLIIYKIGGLLFDDRRLSLVAAFLIAVNPSMIEFAIEPQRDMIYLFFCGWLIYCIIRGLKYDSVISFCSAGVFFAFSIMTRYETLEIIPLFFFALIFCGIRKYIKWKRILLHIGISVFSAAAVILSLTFIMGVQNYTLHTYQQYYQSKYDSFEKMIYEENDFSGGEL